MPSSSWWLDQRARASGVKSLVNGGGRLLESHRAAHRRRARPVAPAADSIQRVIANTGARRSWPGHRRWPRHVELLTSQHRRSWSTVPPRSNDRQGSSQGPARHPHGSAHGATPHQPAADPATGGGRHLCKGLHDRFHLSGHPASGSTRTCRCNLRIEAATPWLSHEVSSTN